MRLPTEGLHNQKVQSLSPFKSWWYDCLFEGNIPWCEFGEEWPEEIPRDAFRKSLGQHIRERNIRTWSPSKSQIGRLLREVCPSARAWKKRIEGVPTNTYQLPPLAQARAEWERHMGHKTPWEEEA